MPDADLLRRVEMLEKTVESLQSLPADVKELSRRVGRVESQVLQLQTEVRGEISAIRRDMREDLKPLVTKEDLKAYATKEDLQDAVAGAVQELSGAILETRDDLASSMREQFVESRRHTTILFEDLAKRLRIIREGDPTPD